VDLRQEFHKAFVLERNNEAVMDRFRTDYLPRYFKIFNDQLAKNKTGFLVGDKFTWADLFLYNYSYTLGNAKEGTFVQWENYPEVKKHRDLVNNLPFLANFKHM
jgi:glutathione S-transferase